MIRKIFKNSSYLILAQGFVKVISFIYTLYLAKILGVSEFGLFIVALSYFSLVSSISDLGISRFLIRETAREKVNLASLISNILLLRLIITTIFTLVFILVMINFDLDIMRANLSLIAVLAIIPQAIGLTFDNIFIAFQKLSVSAIALIITTVSTIILGVFLISLGFGAMGAVMSLLLGQIFYSLFLLFFAAKKGIKFNIKLEKKVLKQVLKGSLPYGLLATLGVLYFRIDVILLSYLKGSYDAGIYGAAYKFLEALVFIPSTISLALFPILVKLHEVNQNEIKKVILNILIVMGGLGFFATIGFIFILPFVLGILLPDYSGSITTIKILSLALPFMFIHVPLSQILLSSDKYLKPLIIISFLPVTLNIILNWSFIPQYGYLAAAWVTVISDIFSLVMLLIILQKYFLSKKNG